jgi:hypothetical protein
MNYPYLIFSHPDRIVDDKMRITAVLFLKTSPQIAYD